MPELPEVQTICNQLSKEIKSFKIIVWQEFEHAHKLIKRREFNPQMQYITQIVRHGKKILFYTDSDNIICSQLGMSGQWRFWKSKPENYPKHTHLVLVLDNNCHLAYVDPRRFGKIMLIHKNNAQSYIKKWGDDILSDNYTLLRFEQSVARYCDRKIKVSLLDQSLFPGIGNYLASEICAHAKILPTRSCNDLDSDEVKLLYQSMIKVINQSVDLGGNTFQGGYIDSYGEKGEGVKGLIVFYQDICQSCKKNPVTKIMLAQRGTYFCSVCQS